MMTSQPAPADRPSIPGAAPLDAQEPSPADAAAPHRGLDRWAPYLAGLVLATPVMLVRFPPMTDLPLHEAIVGILRHWRDPNYVPEGLYLLNIGHPNQLFYLFAWLLSLVFSVAFAVKLVVAGAVFALPASAARLADHVGTPRWTALLVAPLGLGWMFFWGLIANMLGLSVLLWSLPALDRFCKTPNARGAFRAFLALLLLYFAHESMMLIAIAMMGLFSLCHRLWSKETLLRLVPLVAIFGVALLEITLTKLPPVTDSIPLVFQPLLHKLEIIPGALFAGYEMPIRTTMFAMAMIPLVLFAVARLREDASPRDLSWKDCLFHYRFEVAAVCLLIGYFIMPFTFNGATLFYHRFLPPAYALLVITLAPHRKDYRPARLHRFAAGVVPVGSLLLTWPIFVDADKLTKDVDTLAEQTLPGQAYMVVDIGPTIHWRLFHPATWEGHVTAQRGGRSLFDFTQSPISPAYMNPKYRWDEPYWRMRDDSNTMKPDHDLNRFRYVFLHTTVELWGRVASKVLEPDARLIDSRGEWFLFESKHLTTGPVAPDAPLPIPHPASLRRKMRDYMKAHAGEDLPPPEIDAIGAHPKIE